MTTGAQRAEAQPDNGIADTDRGDWEVLQANEESAEAVETFEWAEEEQAESPARPRILAGLLSLLAVGWIGVVAWSLGAKRWWLAFVIGLALGIAVQVVFGGLMGLSLPWGPAVGWLGGMF